MNILKAILATVIYIVFMELFAFWIYIPELFKIENYIEYYIFIQGSLQFLVVLLFLFIFKKYRFKNILKKTHYKWYLFAFVAGVAFVFMQTPLKWLYNYIFDTDYYISYDFNHIYDFKKINLLVIILLLPIGEELFFRGYIQKNLQLKATAIVSILVASLLFAFIHAPYSDLYLEESYQDWHLFYLTFFGGMLSGIIYYASKSIGPSIVFHIFWNLMASSV